MPIGPHPQYKEIVDYPPKGIEYEVLGKTNVSQYYSKDIEKLRSRTNSIIKIFGVPRMAYYKTDADIIFSTRGILPITRKPWVTEVEHPYAFVGLDYRNWGWRQKMLIKLFFKSKNCKSRYCHNPENRMHCPSHSAMIIPCHGKESYYYEIEVLVRILA